MQLWSQEAVSWLLQQRTIWKCIQGQKSEKTDSGKEKYNNNNWKIFFLIYMWKYFYKLGVMDNWRQSWFSTVSFVFIICELPRLLGKDSGVVYVFEVVFLLDWLPFRVRKATLRCYFSHIWAEDIVSCLSKWDLYRS